MPSLQVGGQVVQFLGSRGFPIPSPAVISKIGDSFRRAVRFGSMLVVDRGYTAQ